MDQQRKELLQQYKDRDVEMGVIFFRCAQTGETFYGLSKDTRADLNSTRFKLSAGNHPNRRMQELWNQYGSAGFLCGVEQVLERKDPTADPMPLLEAMRDKLLAADPSARKIWR